MFILKLAIKKNLQKLIYIYIYITLLLLRKFLYLQTMLKTLV